MLTVVQTLDKRLTAQELLRWPDRALATSLAIAGVVLTVVAALGSAVATSAAYWFFLALAFGLRRNVSKRVDADLAALGGFEAQPRADLTLLCDHRESYSEALEVLNASMCRLADHCGDHPHQRLEVRCGHDRSPQPSRG